MYNTLHTIATQCMMKSSQMKNKRVATNSKYKFSAEA